MTKQAKTLETIALDALVPYARNSRTHSEAQVAQIAASIREFGFTNPVLIDGSGGIIAGHGRVLAARKLGMKTVPTIRIDYLTESQRRAYVIADNKLALNAGWDDELLALELGELKVAGFDLALTGFSDEELTALLLEDDEPPDGDGDEPLEELEQMTFTLTREQSDSVTAAIAVSKSLGAFIATSNENADGNALARACELFLGSHGSR